MQHFQFNEDVSSCFQDMIYRSIPSYQHLQHIIIETIKFYSKPHRSYIDYGCSTGNSLLKLRYALKEPDSDFIGVDTSKTMLDIAKKRLDAQKTTGNIQLYCQSILKPIPLNKGLQGALCVLTLHFLKFQERLTFLKTIHKQLEKDGVFILVEKIKHPKHQDLFDKIHNTYRQTKGYQKIELLKKKEALQNILVPQDTKGLVKELKEAGFKSIENLWQHGPFIALIATKHD